MQLCRTEATIRVLLVGIQQVTLVGLGMLIDSEPGLKVVGRASAIDQVQAVAAPDRPDVTLLDLGYRRDLDFVHELQGLTGTDAKVIVLTSVSDPTARSLAFRHGAMGQSRSSCAHT